MEYKYNDPPWLGLPPAPNRSRAPVFRQTKASPPIGMDNACAECKKSWKVQQECRWPAAQVPSANGLGGDKKQLNQPARKSFPDNGNRKSVHFRHASRSAGILTPAPHLLVSEHRR